MAHRGVGRHCCQLAAGKKLKIPPLHSTTRAGLSAVRLGSRFDLIFYIPLVGAAIGAATGPLVGSMTDVGISGDFIKNVRDEVAAGISAFMNQNVVVD